MAIIIKLLEGGKKNPNNDMTLMFEGHIKRIPCGVPDDVRVVDLYTPSSKTGVTYVFNLTEGVLLEPILWTKREL